MDVNYYDEYRTYKRMYKDKLYELFGGSTPNANIKNELLNSVKKNNTSKVKELLKKGANINSEYDDENTLLHIAVRKGLDKMVKLLVKSNIKINARNKFDDTALHELASTTKVSKKKTKKIFKILSKEDVKLDKRNENGNTPLHLAVIEGNVTMVKLLIKDGAKKKIKNHSNSTPLQIAQKNIKYESGKDYNKMVEIINVLSPKTVYVSSPSHNISKNINFITFIGHYFPNNYNQLSSILSLEDKNVSYVVKCRQPPVIRGTNVVLWNDFVSQFQSIYDNMLYRGIKPNLSQCWVETVYDLYILYLLIKVRELLTDRNITLYYKQNVNSIPYNRVDIDVNYKLDIKDGSYSGNQRIRQTLEQIIKFIGSASHNSRLYGGIYGNNQFLYIG